MHMDETPLLIFGLPPCRERREKSPSSNPSFPSEENFGSQELRGKNRVCLRTLEIRFEVTKIRVCERRKGKKEFLWGVSSFAPL